MKDIILYSPKQKWFAFENIFEVLWKFFDLIWMEYSVNGTTITTQRGVLR
jgi:hypothetical protein